MKIVIDIPEILFEKIQNRKADKRTLETVIKCGTPLPKGHGRLIDADELKKHKYHDNYRYENAVSIAQVDWQPTIVEADAESEDKE